MIGLINGEKSEATEERKGKKGEEKKFHFSTVEREEKTGKGSGREKKGERHSTFRWRGGKGKKFPSRSQEEKRGKQRRYTVLLPPLGQGKKFAGRKERKERDPKLSPCTFRLGRGKKNTREKGKKG